MTDELFAVVSRQRACRTFTDERVTDALVARLLEAATYAPSAENRQPWEFVVVRDPELRARIGEITEQAWTGVGRSFSETRLSPILLADVDAGATGGVAAAPVLIVVCADTERGLAITAPSSVFPAIQNLLLAATALGLGSALTTIATGGSDLSDALGLPDHVLPLAVVPIGHPARPLGPPRRDPFTAHTHRDRFGTPW